MAWAAVPGRPARQAGSDGSAASGCAARVRLVISATRNDRPAAWAMASATAVTRSASAIAYGEPVTARRRPAA